MFPLIVCCVCFARINTLSRAFREGHRALRAFTNITSLADLPTMTGDEYEMLVQWLAILLQDGDGILDRENTKVRRFCPGTGSVISPTVFDVVLLVCSCFRRCWMVS